MAGRQGSSSDDIRAVKYHNDKIVKEVKETNLRKKREAGIETADQQDLLTKEVLEYTDGKHLNSKQANEKAQEVVDYYKPKWAKPVNRGSFSIVKPLTPDEREKEEKELAELERRRKYYLTLPPDMKNYHLFNIRFPGFRCICKYCKNKNSSLTNNILVATN